MFNWASQLNELLGKKRPFVLATVVKSTGSTPRETGAKMFVLENGDIFGTIGGGMLEMQVISDAKNCFLSGTSQIVEYSLSKDANQVCGGSVQVFLELLNVSPNLYIFGAGHVGQAVCQVLTGTAFSIEVIDERQEWISSKEIPCDVTRIQKPWQEFLESAKWCDKNTYVCIVTHCHTIDHAIVKQVIKKPTKYVGLIGSRGKWETFRKSLEDQKFTAEEINKVTCPIGLDLGGKAPKEIAISIASQLLQIYYHGTS